MTIHHKKKKRRSKKQRRTRRLLTLLIVLALFLCAYNGVRYFMRNRTMILYRLSAFTLVQGQHLSDAVEAYRPTIRKYAKENGIEPFEDVIAAMMMQESKGEGNDPMQASESPHNKRYAQTPGGITDPDYSIEVGVRYFAGCLSAAGCTDPSQTNALMLAIQGYNYGGGYIAWALKRDGGYNAESAKVFSEQMREKTGWAHYGDPSYAYKVMTYVNVQR